MKPTAYVVAYEDKDLLPNQDTVISFGNSPVVKTASLNLESNSNQPPVIFTDTAVIPALNLINETKVSSLNNEGVILRFLTEVYNPKTEKCKDDNFNLDYDHIIKYAGNDFFKKLKFQFKTGNINSNLSYNPPTSSSIFATFKNILLKHSDSTIGSNSTLTADLYFLESGKQEIKYSESSSARICVIDVKAKLVLRPSESNLNKSGYYDLLIKWQK